MLELTLVESVEAGGVAVANTGSPKQIAPNVARGEGQGIRVCWAGECVVVVVVVVGFVVGREKEEEEEVEVEVVGSEKGEDELLSVSGLSLPSWVSVSR